MKSAKFSMVAGAALAVTAFAAPPALAEMAVSEVVLTSGVTDREPVDNVAAFKIEDGKAFVFARLKNTDAPTKVNFIWYLDDVERARVAMKIGTSERWRTWSSSNIGPGNWRVDLVDESGTVLAQQSFTVGNMTAKADDAPAASSADASPAASPAEAPSIAEKPANN
jgi:hypothetical protein